ncbi:MAG: S-layer homology domain-containing protein [Oscillospiraceae bacterium]|nr:S-layer homology domain-containing protein [Oscillospiraceae bacterium]
MKSLLQRFTCFILAVLLCCGVAEPVFAYRGAEDPFCELGAEPSDMLAGGGRRVRAEECVYYINDSDGSLYELANPTEPVLEGPLAGLNYAEGVLYFARQREEDFDLCAYDLEAGEERAVLKGFSGQIGQLYLVDGQTLVFSSGDSVWEFPLEGRGCRLTMTAQGLRSFVPTGCGIIYATGSLFDCSLYAGGKLLAHHVEDYTVRFDLEEGLLVYSSGGKDFQMDLAQAFAGEGMAVEFAGVPYDPEVAEEGLDWYIPQPEEGYLWATGAITGGCVKKTFPSPLFPDKQLRMQPDDGTMNIVRRARQMLSIQWTPVDGIGGWGYTDPSYSLEIYYEPGVTYTGLPYGQLVSYVPWNTSYAGFINSVNEITSKMYTERSTYERGSQYYGTDCSAFVSWAWQTPGRKVCTSLMSWERATKVGRSYTLLQLGDALISRSHAVLVTDVVYSLDGNITSIELSQANPTSSYNGCCYSTRYTGTAALQSLNNAYFVKGSYSIFRNKDRNSVTYSHDCVVPLEGDVCSICGCGSGSGSDPDPYVSVGIDVSEHNGTINWSAVAPQIDFAILRIGYTGNTEGRIYKDSAFDANLQGCIDNNIPFGLYYYAGATNAESAREEADAVLGWLLEKNVSPDLPIFYDVEEPNNILLLPDGKLAEVNAAFCSELEDFGFRAGIYASASVWNSRFSGSSYDSSVHWAAHWDTKKLNVAAGASLWQYTSAGVVPGILGSVDMNYWIGPLGKSEHPSTAVLTAPSCLDGQLVSTCVLCDQVLEQPIRGQGHTPGQTYTENELAPTCTETGVYEEITRCTVCGEIANRMVITIEPLGHVWNLTEVLTEGATPHESTGLFTCSRCSSTKETALCASEIFLDMPKENHWAHNAIDWAYFHNLFRGVSANLFNLDMTMDRAMLVTVLYSLAGRPEVEGDIPFRDVKEKAYYYDPVRWAYQTGVASGTGPDSFSPTTPISREQVAVMLLGYLHYLGQEPEIHEEILDTYPDIDRVSGFALSGMAWAVENGILSGSPVEGVVCLLPRNTASRAQVAVMFMQFTKLLQRMELWTPDCSSVQISSRIPENSRNLAR